MALDLSQFTPVDEADLESFEPDNSGVDLSQFRPVDQNELDQFHSDTSADALRQRLKFNLENDYAPDQGTISEQALIGLGEGAAQLPATAGGVLSFFGAPTLGRRLTRYSQDTLRDYEDLGDALGQSQSAFAAREAGALPAGLAPMIAAGAVGEALGGPEGARIAFSGAAGLQTLGNIQNEAQAAYEAQGLSPEEATNKARIPAGIAGLASTALNYFIPGGAKALLERYASGALSKLATQNILRQTLTDALIQGGISAADTATQGFIAKASYDPERTLRDILFNSLESGASSAGVGLGIGAAGLAARGVRETVGKTRDAWENLMNEPGWQPEEPKPAGPHGAAATPPDNTPIFGPRPPAESDAGRIKLFSKILKAAGYEPEFAAQFAETFTRLYDPTDSWDGEAYRNALLNWLDRNGVRPVDSVGRKADRREAQAAHNAQALENLRRQAATNPTRAAPVTEQPEPTATPEPAATPAPEPAPRPPVEPAPAPTPEPQRFNVPAEIPQPGVPARLSRSVESFAPRLIPARPVPALPSPSEFQVAPPLASINSLAAPEASSSPPSNQIQTQPPAVIPAQPVPAPSTRATSPKYERPPDILDWVESNGGLRRLKPGEQHELADLYRNAQRAVPNAFKGSSRPDSLAEAYRRDTGKDITDGDFLQMLIDAPKRRATDKKAFFDQVRVAKQDAAFQRVIIGNERRDAANTKDITADQLDQGDKFRGTGQRIVASNVKIDPLDGTVRSVTLTDGPKFGVQIVGPDTILHIDKGTLIRAGRSRRLTREVGTGQRQVATGPSQTESSSPETPPPAGQAFNFTNPAFSVNPEGWASVGGPGPEQPAQKEAIATGVAETRALIENSALSDQGKRAALTVLDALAKSNIDLTNLRTRIATYLEGREAGAFRYDALGPIIQIGEAVAANRPDVGAHEVGHIAIHNLSDADRAWFESERLASLPEDAPEAFKAGISSEQFREANLPLDLYPFINTDEFAAHMLGDEASRRAAEAKNPGLWQRLKDLIARIWNAIKSLFTDSKTGQQIIDDILAGRQTYDVNRARASADERAKFVTTGKEAAEAADLAKGPEAKKIEGQEFLAQIDGPVKIMEKFGVQNLPESIQRKFKFPDAKAIQQSGKTLYGPYDFQAVTAGAEPWLKQYLGAMAHLQVVRFTHTFRQLVEDGAAANIELHSPAVRDQINKLNSAFLSALAHEAAFKDAQTGIHTLINEAMQALKKEKLSDIDIARLEGQLRTLRDVAESRIALERLLDDITSVLAATPQGEYVLKNGGAPADISQIYRDLKRSTGQTIGSDQLIGVATWLLSRMTGLREQLLAAHLAKQSGPMASATGRLKKILEGLSKNPAATLERLMRERETKAANASAADFLYQYLQKELTKKLDPIYDRIKAGQVAGQILADPAFQKYADAVAVAGRVYAHGKPFEPFIFESGQPGGEVFNPKSGRFLTNLGPDLISGNADLIRRRYKEATAYLADARDWLDHADPDHPLYQRVMDERDFVENYWGNAALVVPTVRDDPLPFTLSILDHRIRMAGGRVEVQAQKAKSGLNLMSHQAKAWASKTTVAFEPAKRAAMRSHGLKWSLYGERDQHWAAQQFEPHWQELANSNQFRHGGLKVGDKSMVGWTVTREDMALLNAQVALDHESYRLVDKWDRQVTEDTRGLSDDALKAGLAVFRKAVATSERTLPRPVNRDRFPSLLPVDRAYKAWRQNPSDPSLHALGTAIDHLWPIDGMAFLRQRNADFAQKTVFDGAGGAFESIANEIQDGAVYDTFPKAVARVAELSGVDPAQTLAIMAGEFGRITSSHIARHYNEADPSKTVRVTGTDPSNPFTEARGEQTGPWSFYRTGWSSSGDVLAHAGHMISVSNHRMEQGLRAQLADLERQKTDLENRARVLERAGSEKAVREAIAENKRARQRGLTPDNWSNFDRRIGALRNAIQEIEESKLPITRTQTRQIVHRYLSGATRLLIGSFPTTFRNTGQVFPYRTIVSMGGGPVGSFLKLALHISPAQVSKMIGSFAWSALKTPWTILQGVYNGVGQTIRDRQTSQLWRQVLRNFVLEFSKNANERIPEVKEMIDAGVHFIPDAAAEYDNAVADALYRAIPKVSPESKLTFKAKLAVTPIALLESTLLAAISAGNPGIGDSVTNSTFWKYLNSSSGPNATFARKAAALLKRIDRGYVRPWSGLGFTKKAYARTFDFANPTAESNRLDPEDIGLNHDELNRYRRSFLESGLNFDALFVDFLSRLKADPKAQFLTDNQLIKIANWGIDQFNRANQTNQPKQLQARNGLLEVLRPLLNWPTRAAASFMSYMSVPTQVGDIHTSDAMLKMRKMSQWMVKLGTTFLFGVMVAGTVSELQLEGVVRAYRKVFYHQESNNRWPWENETHSQQVQAFARYGLQSVPLLSIPVNAALPQTSPARASFDPSFVIIEKAKDLVAWLSYGTQTGNWWYKTPATGVGFYQDAKILTHLMDSQSGLANLRNAQSIAQRFGPQDLIKQQPFTHSAPANLTPLSPYGERLWNAIYNGDQREVLVTAREAMQVARDIGKPDPRAAVEQLFREGNFVTRAFNQKPSRTQYATMLSNLNASQAAQLKAAETDYINAARILGFSTPTFYQADEKLAERSLRRQMNQPPIGAQRLTRMH